LKVDKNSTQLLLGEARGVFYTLRIILQFCIPSLKLETC
jgi:hypothetical protein